MSSAVLAASDIEGGAPADETLFRGICFWIAQRVPSRAHFIDKVRQNGGQIVPLEKLADILIADHLRHDCPLNSFSYTWIEKSIAEGRLQEKENHRAGPAADYVRPVGALKPAKTGRNPYTAEDDRVLYEWVTNHERQGGKLKGNDIYKQLEQQNSRHPWQSWRDRWIKYVSQKTSSTPGASLPVSASDARVLSDVRTEGLDDVGAAVMPSDPKPLREEEGSPILDDKMSDPDNDGNEEEIAVKKQFASPETRQPMRHANVGLSRSHHTYPSTVPQVGTSIIGRTNTGINQIDAIEAEQAAPPVADIASREKATQPVHRAISSIPRRARESILMQQRSVVPQPFTQEEIAMLIESWEDIESIPFGNYNAAWLALAENHPAHTACEWKEYFESEVLPYVVEENEDTIRNKDGGEGEDASSEDMVVKEVQLLNDRSERDLVINHSSSIPYEISSHFTMPNLELHEVLSTSSTGQTDPQPMAGQSTPAIDTHDLEVEHIIAVNSPTKQTLRGVIVPTLSPEQRIEYNALRPAGTDQEDQTPAKRKRDHASMVHEPTPDSNIHISSKKSRLEDAFLERSQQASSALLNVLSIKSASSPNLENEVISRSSSEDEQKETSVVNREAEVDESQRTIVKRGFEVYESHEIPEGEEENIILNESGSPCFPRHHTRVRSDDALVVFGDPPTDFKLMQSEASSEKIWHDITTLTMEQGVIAGSPCPDADTNDDHNARVEDVDNIKRAGEHTIGSQYILGNEDVREFPHMHEAGISLPRKDHQHSETGADSVYHVPRHSDSMTFKDSGLRERNLVTEMETVLTSPVGFERLTEEVEHDEGNEVNIVALGKSTVQSTTREVEDILDDHAAIVSSNPDVSDNKLERGTPLNDGAYVDYEANNLSVQPDTPSNQLHAEMHETTLRYSSESDKYSDNEQDNDDIVNYPQRVAHPYIDTQALVEFELIDDYLHIPPPEDYNVDVDDGDSASRSSDDLFISSHPRDQMRPTHTDNIPRTGFINLDTQAILEANTQPLVLDEYPQTKGEESQTSIKATKTGNNVTRSSLRMAAHSRGVLPSTPPQQMFYSDDSGHIPSSPPILSTTATIRERHALQWPNSSAQHSVKGQSSTLSTYAGLDPAEAFKARHQALGSTDEDVAYALFRTNFDSRLAAQVLDSMRRGSDLPTELRGVWTEEEDEVLLGGDARAMRMVERKHGSEAYEARLKTLEQFVAPSDDEDG